jgi:hypothetical protein
MTAATARGTSDACIAAWPSPLRAAVLSKRWDLGYRTKLSIEAAVARRGAPAMPLSGRGDPAKEDPALRAVLVAS